MKTAPSVLNLCRPHRIRPEFEPAMFTQITSRRRFQLWHEIEVAISGDPLSPRGQIYTH